MADDIFHGITAVAELKVVADGGSNTSLFEIFHGITAVAELKGVRRVTRPGCDRQHFPRHHRRGRIEGATVAVKGTSPAAIFHGITAVAELKGFHRRVAERKYGRCEFSTASPPWPN